jgi:hypothetical protein
MVLPPAFKPDCFVGFDKNQNHQSLLAMTSTLFLLEE